MKFLNLRVLFVLIYSLSGQLIAQESQWGDKKSGFKLCYRFDSETAAVYQLNYEQKIEMNMNGQPMNADKVFDVGYSLKSPGKSDNNWVQLSVTLDTFTAAMVMDIGKQSYDTRHLIGKKFEMHLPPK